MDGKAADGIGTAILVADFLTTVLELNTTGSANLVLKFQVSYQKERPDFAAAQSPTNRWDYVDVVDLEDGSSIDGDTGITLSGTDANRVLEVNTNGARWVNAIISSYSAGAVHLDAAPYNH